MKLLTIAQVTKFSLLGDQHYKRGRKLHEPKLSQPNGYCGCTRLFAKCTKANSRAQLKRPSATLAQCLLKRNVRLRNSYVENSYSWRTALSSEVWNDSFGSLPVIRSNRKFRQTWSQLNCLATSFYSMLLETGLYSKARHDHPS